MEAQLIWNKMTPQERLTVIKKSKKYSNIQKQLSACLDTIEKELR